MSPWSVARHMQFPTTLPTLPRAENLRCHQVMRRHQQDPQNKMFFGNWKCRSILQEQDNSAYFCTIKLCELEDFLKDRLAVFKVLRILDRLAVANSSTVEWNASNRRSETKATPAAVAPVGHPDSTLATKLATAWTSGACLVLVWCLSGASGDIICRSFWK